MDSTQPVEKKVLKEGRKPKTNSHVETFNKVLFLNVYEYFKFLIKKKMRNNCFIYFYFLCEQR